MGICQKEWNAPPKSMTWAQLLKKKRNPYQGWASLSTVVATIASLCTKVCPFLGLRNHVGKLDKWHSHPNREMRAEPDDCTGSKESRASIVEKWGPDRCQFGWYCGLGQGSVPTDNEEWQLVNISEKGTKHKGESPPVSLNDSSSLVAHSKVPPPSLPPKILGLHNSYVFAKHFEVHVSELLIYWNLHPLALEMALFLPGKGW